MKSMRIIDHPVLGKLEERKEVKFTFDGKPFSAYEGETIAAALLAHGVRTLRCHEEKNSPRGIYCNIGHCFECRVDVDGKSAVRACITPVTKGMRVESGMLNSTKGVKS